MLQKELGRSVESNNLPLAEIILHNQEEWRKRCENSNFLFSASDCTSSYEGIRDKVFGVYEPYIGQAHQTHPPRVYVSYFAEREIGDGDLFFPEERFREEGVVSLVEANVRWLTAKALGQDSVQAVKQLRNLSEPSRLMIEAVEDGESEEVTEAIASFQFSGETEKLNTFLQKENDSESSEWKTIEEWLGVIHEEENQLLQGVQETKGSRLNFSARGIEFASKTRQTVKDILFSRSGSVYFPGVVHIWCVALWPNNLDDFMAYFQETVTHEFIHAVGIGEDHRDGIPSELVRV